MGGVDLLMIGAAAAAAADRRYWIVTDLGFRTKRPPPLQLLLPLRQPVAVNHRHLMMLYDYDDDDDY